MTFSFRPFSGLLFGAALSLACSGPALAQLDLPGATEPDQAGATPSPAAPHKAHHHVVDGAVADRIPTQDTVTGHSIYLNGIAGEMQLDKVDSADKSNVTLKISKLSFAGDKITSQAESCKVDIAPATAITAHDVSQPGTLKSFQTDLAGCAFSFDVMDGAIRVHKLDAVCVFKAADCQADPSGVWGPSPAAFGPDKIAELGRNRAAAENAIRKDYKVLMEKAHKEKGDVKPIAHEQASFSSERAQTCSDYSREGQHGFCDTAFTEARAALLNVRLNGMPSVAADKPKKPKRKKPVMQPAAAPAPEQF
ncbi:hypothetical protein [Methylovirgula sp. 4M-Z18]|uniref:hypothetical protein n=1 Tax=Methylovirgula sp. 4M-Z18 TaxID=2293567 RepID=UPI000E2EBC13|nr:hypothetical protein [Methylovirgula sp. 4M-Z18]RFB77956.1 hypothetical protein DYH55_18215 [Methylovirgula sp. 4M-Z18]